MLSLIVLIIILLAAFKISCQCGSHKLAQGCVLVFFNALIVEVFSYIYLLILVAQGGNFFLIGNQGVLDKLMKMYHIEAAFGDERSKYSTYRVDNDLGYTLGKNKFYAQYKMSNSQGLRSEREYTLAPLKDVLRVAAFGDSFVFCDGELTRNTWANFLEGSSKNLEVMNFGLGGYGLGQSYLRYLKDGLKFKPDVVFLNYVLLTDRDRFSAVDIIRGHSLREAHIYRVRFWIEDGVLKTENMKLMDLFDPRFRQEYIYGPLGLVEHKGFWSSKIFSVSNTGLLIKQAVLKKQFVDKAKPSGDLSPADIEVNRKILENLLETAKENGSTVLFFVKQNFDELPVRIQDILNRYKPMIVYVNGQSLLDKTFASRGWGRQDMMNVTGHYNVKGNQVYAQLIAEILVKNIWGAGDRRFRFDPASGTFVHL